MPQLRTGLIGPWCHAGGQAGEDFYRCAHHPLFEALEGLFHADGRLFRTLSRHIADPDGLTRDYLAGKRAAQIPPIRLYLVKFFIVFLDGGLVASHISVELHASPTEVAAETAKASFASASPILKQAADWLLDRGQRAVEDAERLLCLMHEKAHDFAFLTLPLWALILSAMFVFQRGVLLFRSLGVHDARAGVPGLLHCTALALAELSSSAWLLVLASAMHLFSHMRGIYRTWVFGTLVRMTVLFWASLFGFLLPLAGLVLVGLRGLRAIF